MNIYQSIAAVMADIEAVGKTQDNKVQNYKFRGIDDVYNALHKPMAKHGIFTVPTVLEEKTEERVSGNGGKTLFYRVLKIKYTFYAGDGTSVEAVVIGEGMDSGDKAANKAMAVAHKYALLQVFAIPTDEPKDPENDSHEVMAKVRTYQGTPADRDILRPMMERAGIMSDDQKKATAAKCFGKTWQECDYIVTTEAALLKGK